MMRTPHTTMENLPPRSGRLRRAPLALLVAAIALLGSLAAASAAPAAQGPGFSQFAQICPDGSAGGQCSQPLGLDTSPVNGHLFVSDSRNNRIQEFTPWGEFVKAFGWGVVASGPDNKPQNEIERLTVSGTGGSFKLLFVAPGFTSIELTFPYQPGSGPTAAEVQDALIAAPAQFYYDGDPFEPGDIAISGPPGGPWEIEFAGQYADTDFGGGLFSLKADGTGLTGPGAAAAVTTIQEGANYEVCVPANGDICREGSPGGNPGEMKTPSGIAVDASGNVYVVDSENHRVEKFDDEGNFLLMFGGDVNKTTGEDVCTKAQLTAGDACGVGVTGNPGPGEGQFGPWLVGNTRYRGDFIDVGPDGAVYVGDTNRIQKFSPDGVFESQIAGAVAGQTVQSLAVDGKGEIYVAFVNPEAPGFRSEENVRRLDPSGTQVAELGVVNPLGVETDAAGNVFVFDESVGTYLGRVWGFTSTGEPVDLDPEAPGNALGEGGPLRVVGAIATSSPPTCGQSTTSLYVGSSVYGGDDSSIKLYGQTPDPTACPQPAVPPTIESQFATAVDTRSATLRARVNPHFWPDTRLYVEYGTGRCSEGGCTRVQPTPPGSLLTSRVLDAEVISPAVVLSGLQPATTYHFRFVARSGGGGPVTGPEVSLHTARAPGEENGCPNDVFRIGASASLPDCRAYELVSPLDKASSDVAKRTDNSLVQADPSGQRLSFSSTRSFGDAAGGPLISQYLAQRGSGGWTTDSISPPRGVPSLYPLGASTESNFYKALSTDLCSGWVVQDNPQVLTAGAPPGVPNIYRRDNCGGGGYELVTSSPPAGWGPLAYGTNYYPTLQGFSEDASRTVFRANAALAVSPGSPHPPFVCAVVGGTAGISYRWLRDGVPIAGATTSVYPYRAADAGKAVQCQVTSTRSEKTSLLASETLQVPPVPSPPPPSPGLKSEGAADLPGAPTLSGTAAVGSTLSCTPGQWQGSPTFSYQWFAEGEEIAGATGPTYSPGAADQGSSIQCRLTGTNASGAAVSFSRGATIAADMPQTSGGPQLTGNAEAGQALTCEPGTWLGGPSFAYQWLRDGTAIGGATSAEYTLAAADEGKAIQCFVTATNSEATAAATSPRRVVAPSPATIPPTRSAAGQVKGTPEIGESLNCAPGTWLGGPSFAYQWLRDGTAIGGATSAKYTLIAADAGGAIQCQVTATNAGGSVVALDGTPVYAAIGAPRRVVTTNANYQLYIATGSLLRLVSVLPNGSATDENATAGSAWSLGTASNSREDAVYRSVSADGSRVFWTAQPRGTKGSGPGRLYLRLNATEPQSPIVAGRCKDPSEACTITVSGSSNSRFVSANPQGTRVVYLDGGSASSLSLYTARIDEGGGETTSHSTLIADGVIGTIGASEDATRVYFVSKESLTATPNGRGDLAIAGQPNVYLYDAATGIHFVATISAKDANGGLEIAGAQSPTTPVATTPSRRSARVSPDGLHLAFTSSASLTGYDNVDAVSNEPDAEVFVYDANASGQRQLLCVSCNPSGARPVGRQVYSGISGVADDMWAAARIPGWSVEYHPTRALSDNGNRVFFESYAPLVPGDSNGRADVYQWEAPGEGNCAEGAPSFSSENGGCIRLISSGQSVEDAEFLDATPDGSDVFFITQASLVPDDYGLRDVYDARVDGGFAPREPIGQGCQGEACQGVPAPPLDPTPASSNFVGPGDVKEAKAKACGKGRHKAKRKGKPVCVKNRKRSAKKHSGKKRSAKSRTARAGHGRGGAR